MQLPAYVTFAVLGQQPEVQLPAVAAHLRFCVTCQAEVQALMDLVTAAYTDQVMSDLSMPSPDLSFLDPPDSAPPRDTRDTSRD